MGVLLDSCLTLKIVPPPSQTRKHFKVATRGFCTSILHMCRIFHLDNLPWNHNHFGYLVFLRSFLIILRCAFRCAFAYFF